MRRLMERLTAGYWPIPAICVAMAGGLAIGLIQLDRGLKRGGTSFAFAGGPESARSLLSTIATAMLSLTGLVFSITVVVLALVSSQFSPRALRSFLRDRQNQLTLGVFLGTFVYALVTLRAVRDPNGLTDRFIPGVSITMGFALMVVSIALFVQYIHHISQSIRLVTIVESVAAETRHNIDQNHPDQTYDEQDDQEPPELGPVRVVHATGHGVVTWVAAPRLVTLAEEADSVVRVLPRVGDFVATGTPLLEVSGELDRDHELRATIELSRERGGRQDVAFGFRQLVDIAERALSPGVNDPSTATQCLDQIHDLLRRLVARAYPPVVHRDGDGAVRAVVPVVTWEEHVELAIDEIRHWGADSLQVRRRLEAMQGDLLSVAREDRRRPLLDRVPLWSEPLGPP